MRAGGRVVARKQLDVVGGERPLVPVAFADVPLVRLIAVANRDDVALVEREQVFVRNLKKLLEL